MSDNLLVCVAWPYANSDLHLGHLAGNLIPPDIYARYQRLQGKNVLMVSGSDTHGTPITVRAEDEGVTPEEIVERYHSSSLESLKTLGIAFDLYTHTNTENHKAVTQDIFLTLLEKGYIFKDSMKLFYCESCQKYLSDRFVEGTCPHCAYDSARGDQCDNCGRPLDALELKTPRCRFCGGAPEIRDTEHYFLDLPKFGRQLEDWLAEKPGWRPNVINFTRNLLSSGLRPRAITRDIDWGVRVPVEGFDDKVIYVWFDAVIGYLSATIEWAQLNKKESLWQQWWTGDSRATYFMAKDNIWFHTIIWPAMLLGYGGLNLPHDVPANEFLNLEGKAFSASRNWAVWVPDFLSRYDPDQLRYVLTATMPESNDSDFSWVEFVRRNNDELVATYGNLVHRVLTFAYKRYDGQVPQPARLSPLDTEVLDFVADAFVTVGREIGDCRFRAGLNAAMATAAAVNRYLDTSAPWKSIKRDPQQAATSIYVALRAIDSLKMLFYPFLPKSSQALHEMLGYTGSIIGRQYIQEADENGITHKVLRYDNRKNVGEWAPSHLPAGQKLKTPKPLFVKLDDEIIEQERERLGHQ
jgi:methionyl-tRNA synthetase